MPGFTTGNGIHKHFRAHPTLVFCFTGQQGQKMQRASFSIRTAKSEINLWNGNAEMLLTWLVFVFSDVKKQINVDKMLDVLQDNFVLF